MALSQRYANKNRCVLGLMLCASVDDEQSESALAEVKSQIKLIMRRLNRNSEQQASIESGNYTLQYAPFTRPHRPGLSCSLFNMSNPLSSQLLDRQ